MAAALSEARRLWAGAALDCTGGVIGSGGDGGHTVQIVDETTLVGLDAAAIRLLGAQAAWLRANPALMVRLDGHADQYDTRDYAFAIAERRAAAVRDFLVAQGVAPGRLSIASWGKERPGTMRIGARVVGVGPRVVLTIR